MGENNEQLMQFINWLQQTKFPDASVEQVVQQVQAMSQDPQGQQELQTLVQEFQQSTGMFKKGGKLNQLVERRKKIKKAAGGSKVEGDSDTRRKRVEERVENPDGTTGVRVKEFTISGPPERRDSTMRTWYEPNGNILDAIGNMLIGSQLPAYQTPYKAKRLDLQPMWRRVFNILPNEISPEDMKQFDDMGPTRSK